MAAYKPVEHKIKAAIKLGEAPDLTDAELNVLLKVKATRRKKREKLGLPFAQEVLFSSFGKITRIAAFEGVILLRTYRQGAGKVYWGQTQATITSQHQAQIFMKFLTENIHRLPETSMMDFRKPTGTQLPLESRTPRDALDGLGDAPLNIDEVAGKARDTSPTPPLPISNLPRPPKE